MEKSGEDALIEARRGKAEHLRSRGQNPFANDAANTNRSLLRDIREQFASALVEPVSELRYDPAKVEALAGGREYYVLGRLVSRRGFGKASFLRLRDMSDELQLFAKQDVLGEGFAALE
ncbi:MAG TPA: lysine--tRNA ligase, partial [Polyangiaceae bacterium]|nr:lysine--tRNA ligase [Polyangiaceae bacterium]